MLEALTACCVFWWDWCLLVLAATGTVGWWGWLGVVPLVTGLVRFCPLYPLLGFRTCPLELRK
jgi:hypothetical protein